VCLCSQYNKVIYKRRPSPLWATLCPLFILFILRPYASRVVSMSQASPGTSKRVADQINDTSAKKAKRECAQPMYDAFADYSVCSVHPFFSKEADKSSKPTEFKWIKGPNKTLLHGTNLNPKCSTKVAAFDLDGTIILGSFWSKETEGQWKWWNPVVPSRMKALHDDG